MPYSPELSAAQLSQDPAAQPLDQTYTVSAAAGSTIVDNTVALSIPAGAAGARSGDTLSVSLQPLGQALALLAQSGVAEQTVGIWPPIPRGLARFSASGTVFGVRVADGNGVAVSAFTAPVTLSIKLKPADLVGANGELSVPTVAYLVEPDTPAMVNPDNFPPGSWVFFPASAISVDVANSVVTVQAQALGDAVAVFNRPPPYVRTLGPAALFSGYDPETSLTFGRRVQPTYLQVIEPQIGDRLLVIELATGGYTYVNAADVAVATGVR